jgi:hypothetical protein
MISGFKFEEEGRNYECVVEASRVSNGQSWWWFVVGGDPQRYAPFLAASADTRQSVRTRIVAYYTDRLARRAAPPPPRGQWGRRPADTATAAPAQPAST